MKKSGIKDIARETNLSISTVSRVINGKAKEYRIGEKSQKRVLEAAEKFNYNPSHAAANLRSGKSQTIALVVPTLSNPFFASLASEINNDLRKEGYTALISESNENIELEMEILKTFQSRNIEGLIIVPCGDESDHITALQKQGLPIVCLDRYFAELNIPYVSTNNYQGAYEGTKLLIEFGHKEILGIQGVKDSIPNQQRALGFKAALKDINIHRTNISGNDFSVQNGYIETKLALRLNPNISAIFAFSNTIALGCLKALNEENIRIPEDISLICFDDHPYLDFLSTPLTCIKQPESDLARIATRFLFGEIYKTSSGSTQVLLEAQIILRKSVAKCFSRNQA